MPPSLPTCGVKRINVSLDTLDAREVPRDHALGRPRQGDGGHRRRAGGRAPGQDQRGGAEGRERGRDSTTLIDWAHGRGMDLTLIETMPLGEIDADRARPVSAAVAACARASPRRFTLDDIDYSTGGPARYVRVAETGGRLGFITPLTHNFCESCNRVRRDLHRHALHVPRPGGRGRPARAAARLRGQRAAWQAAIDEAIARKPKGHDFIIDRATTAPGRRAPHERDRRLNQAERRLDAKRSISLRRVLDWLASSDERLSISLPERLS